MVQLQNHVPDDIILRILTYSGARDLLAFQATCRHYHALPTEVLWQALFEQQRREYPIYNQKPSIEQVASTAKGRYQWIARDLMRTELTMSDLQDLQWHFSFLPRSTDIIESSEAFFINNRLYLLKYLWIYPNLTFSLVDLPRDGGGAELSDHEIHQDNVFRETREIALAEPLEQALVATETTSARCSISQYLGVGSFPPHYIARTSKGGWISWNHNVVLFTHGDRRSGEIPDQLQMHISMFRF